ncbi:MAG TPA: hypothetical protein PL017_04025 [Tenuifilaceae bacterium]|nr:hypothetical protein [Tenuifilaceae bacterium]HPJ45243.1 hypothetical protein [Tenuifilaceae bacterium]HPQ33364.1 hypothetical protein [Tenuifilaceae bacterium]HRX67551.1 hypothetical protein [Tenuifilaceae bacterium]
MKLGMMTKDECVDFVEFNITGDNENYNKCDPESFYLNSNVFNIYAGCFERSNHLFEFIGQTKYNSRKIVPLKNELEENHQSLTKIQSLGEFKEYVTGIFLGRDLLIDLAKADPNWQTCWRFYQRRLTVINRDLLKIVDLCINEERVLWVIGY